MRANIVLSILAVAAGAIAISCDEDAAVAPTPERFEATLNGANEPTPIATAAQGKALLSLTGNTIIYQITLSNIDSVTLAHIHAGPAGVNGGVMVNLFVPPLPATGLDFSGVLVEDTVDVVDSVLTRMRNGTAYVNVHTRVNGGGEIRGQIFRQ